MDEARRRRAGGLQVSCGRDAVQLCVSWLVYGQRLSSFTVNIARSSSPRVGTAEPEGDPVQDACRSLAIELRLIFFFLLFRFAVLDDLSGALSYFGEDPELTPQEFFTTLHSFIKVGAGGRFPVVFVWVLSMPLVFLVFRC